MPPTMASPVGLGLPLGLPREIHNRIPELGEFSAIQWLGHVVSIHFICWAVLNKNITLLDLIRNKEVTDVDVSGSLAHRLVAILLQTDSTHIVLQDNESAIRLEKNGP